MFDKVVIKQSSYFISRSSVTHAFETQLTFTFSSIKTNLLNAKVNSNIRRSHLNLIVPPRPEQNQPAKPIESQLTQVDPTRPSLTQNDLSRLSLSQLDQRLDMIRPISIFLLPTVQLE